MLFIRWCDSIKSEYRNLLKGPYFLLEKFLETSTLQRQNGNETIVITTGTILFTLSIVAT